MGAENVADSAGRNGSKQWRSAEKSSMARAFGTNLAGWTSEASVVPYWAAKYPMKQRRVCGGS